MAASLPASVLPTIRLFFSLFPSLFTPFSYFSDIVISQTVDEHRIFLLLGYTYLKYLLL